MLNDRNDLAHEYDEGKAIELAEKVISTYIPEFERVGKEIKDRYGEEDVLN